MGHTILITGATGFLGSALCAGLGREHAIIGLFRRPPNARLKAAAPGVQWMKGDVADSEGMHRIFAQCRKTHRPIELVIHFAAFTGFGDKWEAQYTRTNVKGTWNVIRAAAHAGARRMIFAGSIAALEPPEPGRPLKEITPAGGKVAYARSKALGEELVRRASERLPALVLRLGGVFTHWCELPPLFSVIRLWSRPLAGRIMPGKGLSGFPYIHRKDVVDMVAKVVAQQQGLKRFDTFFASPAGATCQKDLFPVIRSHAHPFYSQHPIHIPPKLAKMVLHTKFWGNSLLRRKTYERAWMIDYVDRPLVVDTDYTRQTLGWEPCRNQGIMACLPSIMAQYKADPRSWTRRNIRRNDQRYGFTPD